MNRPDIGYGMRHVALYVKDMVVCEHFYVDLLGMSVEWRPDKDNVYLSSGSDNLALHQAANRDRDEMQQRLDHIGFFVKTHDDVDQWYQFLTGQNIRMRTEPRTHRDGARSFYCFDPDGTVVQIICHPPVCEWENDRG